jgi:hypothetical protein
MHGFVFFLGPEWYGYPLARRDQKKRNRILQTIPGKRCSPEDVGMDIALALTLVTALAINIALLAHYLG